ncbi:MAG: SGNH/GDSL hydrolase family protein [Proteobacteria bacterium]|nr:SGNH/GDSL hydrolase family protein [Pseudomonadota bacterium]
MAAYLLLTLLVGLTFFPCYYFMTGGHWTFWAYLGLFGAAIWVSFPAYKSTVLRVVTTTLTLLIVANALASPIVIDLDGPPLKTLTPNVSAGTRIVGDKFPGIHGVQTFTTDFAGHRVNRPIDYDRKPPNTLRIVAIGASTTHQAMLGDRNTWTDLLAVRLEKSLGRPVEMINTGVSGTRLQDNFTVFEDSASYAPDIALFLIGINDWNVHIKLEHRPAIFKALSFLDPFTVSESILFRAVEENITWYVRTYVSDLIHGQETVTDGIHEEAGPDDSLLDTVRRKPVARVDIGTVSPSYAKWFARISRDCGSRNILCLFISQPTAYSSDIEPALLKLLWMTPPAAPYTLDLASLREVADTYNNWLRTHAQGGHRAFCDAAAGMPPTTDFFTDDCHYNENGARRMSEIIERCLLEARR